MKLCQNGRHFSSRVAPLTVRHDNAAPHALTHGLDELRLIRVSGSDRVSFLQGQLTQDMRTISPERSALFGWATAQGRLLAVGQVFEWGEACWLTVPAAMADALLTRLQKYVLRARVAVELSNLTVTGLAGLGMISACRFGGAALAPQSLAAIATGDCLLARVAGDPQRALVLAEAAAAARLLSGFATRRGSASDWRLADIRAGLPSISAETSETFTPQMVNLDLIGAVSFDKGCYTGQEIVTRTRHLGRAKRRMLRFRCAGAELPVPGDAIFGAERAAGHVVISATTAEGAELLAVTQLSEASGPLFIDAARRCGLLRLDLPYLVPERDGA